MSCIRAGIAQIDQLHYTFPRSENGLSSLTGLPVLLVQLLEDKLERLKGSGGGQSQRKIAKKRGIEPDTLHEWEAGRHHPIREKLDLIGKAFQFG
jgi:hypothetical protein